MPVAKKDHRPVRSFYARCSAYAYCADVDIPKAFGAPAVWRFYSIPGADRLALQSLLW